MPRIQSNTTTRDGESNVFLFVDGQDAHIAHSSNENFDKIVAEIARLEAKQAQHDNGQPIETYPPTPVELPTAEEVEALVDLFSPAKAIQRRFARTSFDRLTIRDGAIYLDNEEVTNALTDQILRFMEDDEDFDPLVRFYEKLLSNTDDRNPEAAEHSRQQLYRWLASNSFSITPDGDILAYKGVNRWTKPESDHPWAEVEAEFCSTRSGPGIVDGVEGNGLVPQPFGGIIELPRSKVTFDPNMACASGLHVSHFSYASDFMGTGIVLEILVSPRDVVSITTDEGDRKMRVSRYTVLGLAHGERTDAVVLPQPAPEPTPEPEVESPTEPVAIFTTTGVDGMLAQGYPQNDYDYCSECGEVEDDCDCYWADDDETDGIDAASTAYQAPTEPEVKTPAQRLRDFFKGGGKAY